MCLRRKKQKKEPVRLHKVEDKKPLWMKLQILQTIFIIILLIGMFILIAIVIGSWENTTNYYNHPLAIILFNGIVI